MPIKTHFKSIDLQNPTLKDLCIKFCEDSFIASFGDAKRFHEADLKGAERYIEFLKSKQQKDPNSVVHLYEDKKIIGQLEMGAFKDDPKIGYVTRYYLVPEKRGKGYSAILDMHATQYLRSQNFSQARLSVSPTNTRAIKFYEKLGWIDIGPRPSHPEVRLMQKQLLP